VWCAYECCISLIACAAQVYQRRADDGLAEELRSRGYTVNAPVAQVADAQT
jgi:hypothetical protein